MILLFETARLSICQIDLKADLIYLLGLHNHTMTMRWIPNNKIHWTRQDLEIKYRINQQSYQRQIGLYKILWKENDQRSFIGEVGLFSCQDCSTTLEIGYILHQDYWKNGFATELLEGIALFTRNQLPYITTLRAQLFDGNIPSKRLLQRCGYSHIQTLSIDTVHSKLVYEKKLF